MVGPQTASPARPPGSPEGRPTPAAARAIYPYSVVPGGVLTPQEVEDAMDRDPVVAAHYAGLNARSLHVVHLVESRDAFVSYRIGDQVFWTSRKLRVKAGETVLTDGNITVRARCGNQIAGAPLGPTSPAEPSAEVLDASSAPTMLANGGGLAPGGSVATSGGSWPAAESDWASVTGSSQPRGTVLWPGSGPRRSTETGSGNPGPTAGPGGDPPSFDPGPPPPGAPPVPEPNPRPGPNADPDPGPDPGPDPNPGPKFGPTTDPDPGPHPRNDPRPGPPRYDDPDNDPVPVPEPTTLVLVGIGAGSAVVRHLRKRRSSPR